MQSLADLISRMVQSATSLYQLKALEPEPQLVECLTKALYDMETVNDKTPNSTESSVPSDFNG